jgi:type I restriction enzyme S subunit
MKYCEKYIYSGNDWVGLVPSTWRSTQLKYISSISKGRKAKEDFQDFKEGMIPYLSMEYLRSQTDSPSFVFADDPNIVLVEEQDLLILWDGSKAGEIVKAKQGALSSTMGKIHVESDLFDLNYLIYYLKNAEIYIQANTVGMGIPHVSGEVLRTLYITIPKKEEQIKIAQYLDHQTAIIDQLILQKEKMIELLKERRQAVINEAVTKGLDPNAKMKDSGIEWLGEVPEYWEVTKMKFIATITRGAILRPVDDPAYFDDNGEWTYLNISDATKCDKYLFEGKLRLSELGSTKSARVYPDNLILTASATIGKPFINRIPVCVHDGFIPVTNIKCSIDYLYHYLRNPQLYVGLGKVNTQKNIYLDEVKDMFVTQPPLEEQLQIVDFLEKFEVTNYKLLQQIEVQIEKLKEYRQSIISEAVTGKIDVRDWQPNKQQNN